MTIVVRKKVGGWVRLGSAVLLLVSLFLPFLAAAQSWSTDPEASLPACCRSHGKHRCFMRNQLSQAEHNEPSIGSAQIAEKCHCTLPSSSHNATDTNGLLRVNTVGDRSPDVSKQISEVDQRVPESDCLSPFSRGPPVFSHLSRQPLS